MGEHAHHEVVVPRAADTGGIPLPAFHHEAASPIAADGARVVVDYPKAYPVKSEWSEGVSQHEPDDLASQTHPDQGRIVQADRETSPPVMGIERVEAGLAEQTAVVLDHPSMRMS